MFVVLLLAELDLMEVPCIKALQTINRELMCDCLEDLMIVWSFEVLRRAACEHKTW